MMRNPVSISAFEKEDLEALSSLKVKPFQQVFCEPIEKIITAPEAPQSIHIIRKSDDIVGMFQINTQAYLKFTFAQFNTPFIQNFMIDQKRQSSGSGKEACRMMQAYLKGLLPNAVGVYALVNTNNAGAFRCFTRGGWYDTGEQYTLGLTGSQAILSLRLK
jgi:hypothetical protein